MIQNLRVPTPKTLTRRALAALALAVLTFGFSVSPMAVATGCSTVSDCNAQINNLDDQNSSDQSSLSQLETKADSYKQTIDDLQSQIDGLQTQIDKNRAEQTKLDQEIAQDKQQIIQEKAVLGDDIKTMYVDGQMSTIEELATSNNLSDYVNKEEYRVQVQNKIQDTLDQINTLEKSLQKKQSQVKTLIENEQTQQDQVQSSQNQEDKLLAYNSDQQAAFNAQIANNRRNIGSLEAQLIALNTTSDSQVIASGTCGGSYPARAVSPYGGHWGCDYAQDGSLDNWKMDNRECVSYTAWMVHKLYHYNTTGWGNAYQWIGEAESNGIPVSQTPQAGDIAIRDADWSVPGDVGHAMYVVSARSSSDITVWEYNEHYNGTWDERTFNPLNYSAPVYYLHFADR